MVILHVQTARTNYFSFISLFGHRFASHCCECLFIQSAPVVTEELKATRKTDGNAIFADDEAKMEDLFISVITEIEENLGYLMTNTFASHPLRVLLLILSGEPIIPAANKHVLHSRRKEHVAIVGFKEHLDNSLREEREVPTAFTQSLESIIYKSIAGLDTNQLRSLSAHKTGNPILQLLLRLELSKFGKQRGKQEHSILHTLLPDNALTSDSSSSAFVTGLIYDTIGSRLLETVIEFAPAKTFKAIYKGWFKDKLSPLCKNDTAAYVVCKALNRIGKEDLQDAISVLGPEIPSLVERNRHNVIRTLVDRAVQRDLDLRPLEKYISASFTGTTETFDLPRLLKITSHVDPQSTTIPKPPHRQPKDSKATHASLLAQSILSAPAPLSTGPLTSLTQLPTPLLLTLAHSPTYSPLLTIFLTLKSTTNPSQRRKLISSLYGHFSSLALDPSGSRVVEAVWPGTRGLAFMRERVAEELAESESALKSSPSGKHVWRTWQMDEYRRRRRDWVARSRDEAGTDGFVGFPDEAPVEDKAGQQQRGVAGAAGAPKGRHMTALQRARERHAKEKMRKEMAGTPATGANATF